MLTKMERLALVLVLRICEKLMPAGDQWAGTRNAVWTLVRELENDNA